MVRVNKDVDYLPCAHTQQIEMREKDDLDRNGIVLCDDGS